MHGRRASWYRRVKVGAGAAAAMVLCALFYGGLRLHEQKRLSPPARAAMTRTAAMDCAREASLESAVQGARGQLRTSRDREVYGVLNQWSEACRAAIALHSQVAQQRVLGLPDPDQVHRQQLLIHTEEALLAKEGTIPPDLAADVNRALGETARQTAGLEQAERRAEAQERQAADLLRQLQGELQATPGVTSSGKAGSP